MRAWNLCTRIRRASAGLAGDVVDDVVAALDVGAATRVRTARRRLGRRTRWVKQAILLYFRRYDSEPIGDGAHGLPTYYDKLRTKRNYRELGARCVPPGVARFGSYLGRNAILMPGYVNIGAYVDDGTMVDTWATVGLVRADRQGRPPLGRRRDRRRARAAAGAARRHRRRRLRRLALHRGRRRPGRQEAVLGAGVVLTASTPIVDVRGEAATIAKGRIEPRSVVIPGTIPKAFPAGTYQRPMRARHRRAAGGDRPEDVARNRPSRLRSVSVNPAIEAVGGSLIRALHAKRRPTSINLGHRRTHPHAGRRQLRARHALDRRARLPLLDEHRRPRSARGDRAALRLSEPLASATTSAS